MKNGQTFIADEMNLSSPSTMKALAPALEPINGQTIYISGVDEPVEVHPEFFFIACQNDIGTIGRCQIPQSISSRFRYFKYPDQEVDDISIICLDIAQNLYKNSNIKPSFSDNDARSVGKYMLEVNKLKHNIIPQWSLRDITKLFVRIHYQDEHPENFYQMNIYINLLFYTLSPVSNAENVLDIIINMITSSFSVNNKEQLKNDLAKCYNSYPTMKKINGKKFLL